VTSRLGTRKTTNLYLQCNDPLCALSHVGNSLITRCSLAADGACGEYGAVGAVAAGAELEPALFPRMQVPVQLRVHQVQTAGQHPHSATVRRHGEVFLFLGNNRSLGSFRRTLYSAKPAQRSCHTGPPCYIGWTGRGSSLCRLAGLYGNSAERS
jgi:hypothetical protein